MSLIFWILLACALLFGLPLLALYQLKALRERIARLEAQLERLRSQQAVITPPPMASSAAIAPPAPVAAATTEPTVIGSTFPTSTATTQAANAAAVEQQTAPAATIAAQERDEISRAANSAANDATQSSSASQQSSSAAALAHVGQWWRWLFAGNWMAKLGALILFVGVAFLVKLAAEHSQLSLELRLSLIAIGAMSGLVGGVYLGRRRPGFGAILQGFALAVLYLLLFAASNRFGLIPDSIALPLMLLLVIGGTTLALLQANQSLAVLALLGGFISPLLTSSGSNNFVGLFTWFTLLNGAVLLISWFRPWPFLNRLALILTYGIGGSWGFFNYSAADRWLIEPFILLAFGLFVAIGHLYPWRHRQQSQFDSGLVLVTPLLTTIWQAKVMGAIPLALSCSALAASGVYLALAWWWRHERAPQLVLLREIDLALAVLFATLALPLAFDGSIASAAWALEGMGLIWLGLRQQRRLATAFGIALQLAAAVLMVRSGLDWFDGWSLLNSAMATLLILALPALIGGALLWQGCTSTSGKRWLALPTLDGQGWPQLSRYGSLFLLLWGSGWLLSATRYNLEVHTLPTLISPLLLALLLAGGGLLQRYWPLLQSWLWLALLWGLLALLNNSDLPLATVALIVLSLSAIGWGSLCLLLKQDEQNQLWQARWLVVSACWLQLLASVWLLTALISAIGLDAELWQLSCWWLAAVGALLLLQRPLPQWLQLQGLRPLLLPLFILVICLLLLPLHPGSAAPLPWLPLFNIKTLLFSSGVLLLLRTTISHNLLNNNGKLALLAAGLFIAVHGEIFAAAHYWGAIDWHFASLWHSGWVQAAMALCWSIGGLLLTLLGHRRQQQPLWWAGAALLAATVLKLLMVDLAGSGSVARIVSFMAVGALILAVGYLAPPPRRGQEEAL